MVAGHALTGELKSDVDLMTLINFHENFYYDWNRLDEADRYSSLRAASSPIPDLTPATNASLDIWGVLADVIGAQAQLAFYGPSVDLNYELGDNMFYGTDGPGPNQHAIDLLRKIYKEKPNDFALVPESRDRINEVLPGLAEYAAWGMAIFDKKGDAYIGASRSNDFLMSSVTFYPPGGYPKLMIETRAAVAAATPSRAP
jgi:hypothetical protein